MSASHIDVLVTGAAGFIGESLVGRLLAEGRRVAGVDVRAGAHPTLRMDVTHQAEVEARIHALRPRALIHCAAIVDDRVSRAKTYAVNVGGTDHVLRAARNAGVERFVHVSSIAALGLDPGATADESSPLRDDSGAAYFDTKAVSERHVREEMARGELEVVVVRPGDVFGPASEPWVRRPLALLRRNLPLLIDGGRGRMSHTWVDNLVDGLLLALDHDAAPGGVFTIHDGGEAGDLGSTYAAYMERLARAAHLPLKRTFVPRAAALATAWAAERARPLLGPPSLTVAGVRYLTRRTSYSLARARSVLGYAPRVDLDEAMTRIEEALRTRP